ncbi:Os09g0306800, partial [Oryza sativa Japonica Group]
YQMCRHQPRARLSPDEQLAAEESFALYCKPVELYNIIQRRSIKNPAFLQRCLLYKIHARRKKRSLITISLSGGTNKELRAQNIFPLYVLLARPTNNVSLEGHSPIYRFSRACLLTSFHEFGNKDYTEATFVIPDVKNLATSRACSLNIILISCGRAEQTFDDNNCSGNHVEGSTLQKLEGKCFWGKIPIDLLASSLGNCVSLSLGHTVEMSSTVEMTPSFLEPKFLEDDSCLTFCSQKVDATGSFQLQVSISAQEAGAKDMSESPYSVYSYNDVPPSSLTHIIRLRSGNVLFNYKYYNNTMQKTEVTEDFSCPFCLVPCGSFKGLGCHLNASHDLFHYEFWISEECQAVNVSLKTDSWRTELLAEGVDPRHQTFSYRSRFKKRKRVEISSDKIRHVHPHIVDSGSPEDAQAGSEDDYVQRENGSSVAHASVDPANSLHGSNLSAPTVLQFGKTRKLSVERADPRNRQLLQKRQFFHSHRAQPMALEQVFSDRDSEDEVDDDIADFEDRRMLDDFVDVTKDEKLIMHMWNSFVRKQRVLADGHIPWACEAFSQFHGQELVQNPALLWCWRFFMVKLWNHSLLDARAMNACNTILEGYLNGSSDPKKN